MFGAAMAGLYGTYRFAVYRDKASKVPWTPREFPFDNLKEEMGGRHDATIAYKPRDDAKVFKY